MMYKVVMIFGTEKYAYGTYSDRNKANEVAMTVREERGCEVKIVEC